MIHFFQRNRFFLFSLLASLALHSFLFVGDIFSEKKTPSKSPTQVQSPLRIDLITVQPKSAPEAAEDGVKAKPVSAKQNANSLKGKQEVFKAKYLSEVRRAIVSRKRFPYAADKLGLSARYDLVVSIRGDGSFEYQAKSSQAHPLFDQALSDLFKEIGAFNPPPKELASEAKDGVKVEFVIEYAN